MDLTSQFANRYKTDMSIQNLRAKVARRKSLTQKENRHKEFTKSRGLALVDVNVPVRKAHNLTVLEEVNEGSINTTAVLVKNQENMIDERRALLQRFQEQKQLRKLKEQREKARTGVFKCGLYKPDNPFIPCLTSQHKSKEKPAPPAVTRVTRSTAKIEASVPNTRSRSVQVAVLHKVAEGTILKGRGQMSSVLKNNGKEVRVPAVQFTRNARATAAQSRLPTVKPAVKTTSVAKPQRTKENFEQKTTLTKPKPAVLDQEKTEKLKPEVTMDEQLKPEDTMDEQLKPEVTSKVTAMKNALPTETSKQEERKPSFAPENFVFQPLDGLSAFKFQPMTPKRASAFLTTTLTWSPLDGKSNFVFTRAHEARENKIHQVSPPDSSMKTADVDLEMDTYTSPETKDDLAATMPVRASPPACTETDNHVQPDETFHNVPYFRGLLKSEIKKLTLLCSEWDKRIEQDIPEDAKDLIRTTVGQTRLLMTERFKQFESLVDNCEFKLGEKETTCTDLDGFWDMIFFQIEDVSKKFGNLDKLQENSWQQTVVQTKKVLRKKTVPAASVTKSQDDHRQAAAKSRLAAIKAAMKNKAKAVEEALVSEQPMQEDAVVFDAVFFRVESPAKPPSCLRKSKTSSKTPSPAKSPVKKALFDTESLQIEEDPRNTESEIAPQVVDMARYLAHTTAASESVADSPGIVTFSSLATEGSELQDDTKFDVTSGVVDDVFMCSPEEVQETENPSPTDGTIEVLLAEGNLHTPLKNESVNTLSDLIVFSPMES